MNVSRKGKMTIGKIDNVPQMALNDCISSGVPHGTIHLDQIDATNLVSSTSNSMPTNFEDVPVLNLVAVIHMETTYNTFYFFNN